MFGIRLNNMSDTRKLLLDYGNIITPLSKTNTGLADLAPLYYSINKEGITVSNPSGNVF